MRKLKLLFLLCVSTVGGALSVSAQTNYVAGWDGGNDTSSPSNFGWTSSANRTLNSRNASGGVRMTTNYSGYKDEDGNNYTYSASSDPSSVIFWVRYGSSGESYTYTFKGLEPNHYYKFSGLVGWHNNSNAPTFTVKLNDGTNDLATMSKSVSTKQKLFPVNANFTTPSSITNTTDIKLVFTCNQTGDCMEAISALKLVDDFAAYEADLSKFIAYASQVNTKLSDSDLATAISTAQGIVDDGEDNATFNDVANLKTAISTAISGYSLDPAGDDVSSFIFRPGFEGMTPESANYATVKGKDYSSEGWTMVETGDWGYGAIMSYGSDKTFNGASVPATDNAGNTGNTLGISVGWGCTQRYQSEVITLKAGSYRLSVKAYNANADAQQFTSKVGFVPTSGDPSLSTKTSFASNTWETDEVDFVLASNTEGRFQIGGTAVSGGSGSNAKIFFDNISLTYFDPLKLAQIQWQEVYDALAALDATALPDAAEEAITDALGASEPTTVEGYNTAKAAMQALINSYAGIKAAYDKVLALIDFATAEKDNSTGDKTTFTTAISTATENIEARTAADDLTSDYNTLETARQTYVTSGAQPTADHVFDYTFKLTNPSFEDGTTGWSLERNTTGQWNYGRSQNSPVDGEYNLDAWAPQINYINVYQTMTLPAGVYEISAYVYSNPAYQQHVYAHNGTDYPSANLSEANTWQQLTASFINYEEVSTKMGLYSQGKNENGNSDGWFRLDNFKLSYKGNLVDDETANALIATVVSGKMNATVASTQTTALSNFESAQTIDNYNALKRAIEAASNSKAVYETLDAAITNAESWTTNATSVTDPMRLKYNNGTYSDETTANNIYAEYQAAEITALVAASASNWTSAIINASFETGDMAGWSAESRTDTGVQNQSNGTYSITNGDPVDGVKLFNSWGGTAENNVYQTIKNLPAGTYTLAAVLAGFKDESLVIAANETTNNVVVAGDKTVGYLTSVTFTLDADDDVVIKASNTKSAGTSDYSFIKVDNFQLYVGSNVPASAYKPTLLLAITKATNARKSANEGSGIFQIPVAAGTSLAGAISTAQGVYDNASATVEQVNQATTDINAARTTYEGTELNAPADGKRYCIKVATAEHAKLGNAVVVTLGSTSDNNPTGYTFNASATPAAYLAQAFTFTQVNGNTYKMSIDMPAGTIYLTNGTKNESAAGWKAAQIQGATDAEKAMEFTIEAGDVANTFYIYNTETNSTIACQTAGYLYTETGNKYFAVEEVSQASVPVAIDADVKFATRIFPFTPSLPTGVKAYACNSIENDVISLEEVAEPAANTPYLLWAKAGCDSPNLTGWGTANADNYTNGHLTGVFTATKATAGDYVLLNKNGQVGFYEVSSESQPTIGEYRCYLSATAGARLSFSFDETSAVSPLKALVEGRVEQIYNASGARIPSLQKGLNIIKMSDGSIRKVMVK